MGDIGFWVLSYFPWLASLIPILAFLAPIIGGGELGVIAVSFLFAKNFLVLLMIIIFSALGMITTDCIWFLIARSKLFIKLKNWKKISAQYTNIEKNIERLSHGRDLLIISFAKLMVGTRILLVIYISGRKISFRKYLGYNSIVNLLWASILVVIGIVAAKGYNSIISIFKNLQLGVTFIIIVIVFLYVLQKWVSQKLTKRQKV